MDGIFIEYHFTVNFIGAGHDVMEEAELGQTFQFISPEDGSHGVVGMAKEQTAATFGDGGLQGVEIEAPAVVREGKRHLDEILTEAQSA